MAKIDSQLEKMEASLGKTQATNLETNPEAMKSVAVHEEVLKEEAAVEATGALKRRHGGRRQKPKKRTQGNGGSRKTLTIAYRGVTRYAISILQGTRLSGSRQGQGCTRNPERKDILDETSDETRRHQGNKEPSLKTAATSEEGDDNRQRHQSMKQETGARSWEREDNRQDLRENHRLEIMKRIAGASVRFREMSARTIVEW
jgi:hypothetical protein